MTTEVIGKQLRAAVQYIVAEELAEVVKEVSEALDGIGVPTEEYDAANDSHTPIPLVGDWTLDRLWHLEVIDMAQADGAQQLVEELEAAKQKLAETKRQWEIQAQVADGYYQELQELRKMAEAQS